MPAVDPFAPFRLDGKVALLTGASSGLGARFARVLDGAGASLLLAARREDRIAELAGGLRDALALRADVTLPGDCDALVSAASVRWGRLDVLVNNAGTTTVKPALEETDEDFARVLAVNLAGPYSLTCRAAEVMIDGAGGAVVNVASVLGLVGGGRIPQAGYTASKGGLVNLTRELGAQWARRGVRVNALCPGWFRSEMTAEMFDDAAGQDWIRKHTPMGRPGTEEELDGALLFLASDASRYMTGQTVVVDGGWTAV